MYLGAVDENFKAAIFSGKNLEAELETKETELFPGLRANVTGIRPIVDAVANVTIKTRNKLADAVTSSASSSMNASGINPVRKSGRYFRANVKIPAESIWTNAQGIDLTAVPRGIKIMSDKIDIDNIRYSIETQEFFQRQVEEAVNTLINKNNSESDKAFSWFMN